MPFFERSHNFTINDAKMHDTAGDSHTTTNNDTNRTGHNFSGRTKYEERKDSYGGNFNGGNFGGNGRGGQGYRYTQPQNSKIRESPKDDSDPEEVSDDEKAMLEEIQRAAAELGEKKAEKIEKEAKKAERKKKLEEQLANLKAQLDEE